MLRLSAPIVRLAAFSMRGVMSSLVPLDDAACDAREGVTSDGATVVHNKCILQNKVQMVLFEHFSPTIFSVIS